MSDEFNPKEWLPSEEPKDNNKPTHTDHESKSVADNNFPNPSIEESCELIITRIESCRTDITTGYDNWLKLGFAFADEFGEVGRSYYHRVSCLNPDYNVEECNKQYDQCLNSKGHGVTIKTFFGFAQDAGIDLRPEKPGSKGVSDQCSVSSLNGLDPESGEDEPAVVLPTLPDEIFPTLPHLLQEVVMAADSVEERDILLLGSLACVSACLPNVFGYYDGKRMFSNLFVFITAQASAGKGKLIHCKQMVKPVHWSLRKQCTLMKQEYENRTWEMNACKTKDTYMEKLEKPPELMLIIPANNSTTGMFQLMHENKGRGLVFETEGDTLTQAFKSDFSNYSDGFRKVFHHEAITYYRRTDHEYVEIECPCLSVLLSGTPKQVASLIPTAENGLFSRFIFYHMNIKPVWKDVFANNCENGLEDHFLRLGKDLLNLYDALYNHPGIKFSFTLEQKERFHAYFTQTQDKYLSLQSSDYMATIRRLGPIAFRIAMILTSLRIIESGDLSDRQECSDDDFNITLSMISVLVKHASYIFSQLPEEIKLNKKKNKKEEFWELVPEEFNYKQYFEISKTIELPERTANRYIKEFCDKGLLSRTSQRTYLKTNLKTNDIGKDLNQS